jgi:beta-lactamase class A
LLAAVLLRESDHGRVDLQQKISVTQSDMVPHAPVTSRALNEGSMTLHALAQATQVTSDNPAANLIIRHLGGTDAVTQLFRALGDTETRLDRTEPHMNLVPPGEVRDTTTPETIAATVLRLFTSDLLKPASRELLFAWMQETRTGMKRLRAGLPPNWKAGDKTGTGITAGMANKHNDVALFWPDAKRAPVVIAAYYEAPGYFDSMRAQDDAVLRQVGEQVAAWVRAGRRS